MKGGELYTLASGIDGGFVITKYDHIAFEQLSQYFMPDAMTCECPAGHRDTCRHRQMLPQMLDLIDTGKFYRFSDGRIAAIEDGELKFEPVNVRVLKGPRGLVKPIETPRPEIPAEGDTAFKRRI